jgi:hypothetical protein
MANVFQFFAYAHLPEPLRSVSREYARQAAALISSTPPSPEATIALRKLLEAKDAHVRATMGGDPQDVCAAILVQLEADVR